MGNLTKRYEAGSNLACAAARLMTPDVIKSRPLWVATKANRLHKRAKLVDSSKSHSFVITVYFPKIFWEFSIGKTRIWTNFL